MKKIVSLALAILLSISILPVQVFANEIHATDDANLQVLSIQLQNSIPDASITIENNTIHVVVNELTDIPGFANYSTYAAMSTPVSSIGGSYRNFRNVILADYYPYSQVYMSKEVATAFKYYLDYPDEFREALRMKLEDLSEAAIIFFLTSKYSERKNGEPLTEGEKQEIEYIAEGLKAFVTNAIIQVAKSSFNSAYSASNNGKVCVVRGYTDAGYHLIYYSPWNDNYVPSFNVYPADWYEGIYDVST